MTDLHASIPPVATVVIPTFNRKDYLREAIRSSLAQSVPVEVIVIDDGSTDGTAEMMAREFTHVHYKCLKGPNGPAFVRNTGSHLASAPVLFPIDDDSVFQSTHTVEQTLAEFDHPRVGAVGIPYINVRHSQEVLQIAPNRERIYATHAYVGCAHAVRRDVFLSLGGYRPELFYMGEEGDFCVRMLSRGYITRLGQADPIHHHESQSRVHRRADLYGRRNDILFGWQNVPLMRLPDYWARSIFGGVRHGLYVGRAPRMIQGLGWGFASVAFRWDSRKPVSPTTYFLYRRLKHAPYLALDIFEAELPPLAPA